MEDFSHLAQENNNEKYKKLVAFVETIKDKGFSWLYRGEALLLDEKVNRSRLNKHLRGTWFTESFEVAQDFKRKEEMEGRKAVIYSLAYPKKLLEERSALEKGMNGGEINIINPELLKSKIITEEKKDNKEITPKIYIDQFGYK